MSRDFRSYRTLIWIGFAIQFAGLAWDTYWHVSNPSVTFEDAGELLRVHSGIYVGVLITAAAVAAALAQQTAPAHWGYRLLALGATGQVIGICWDTWEHAHDAEYAVAHLLIRLGLLLTIVGLVRVLRLSPRQWSARVA